MLTYKLTKENGKTFSSYEINLIKKQLPGLPKLSASFGGIVPDQSYIKITIMFPNLTKGIIKTLLEQHLSSKTTQYHATLWQDRPALE